MLFFELGHLKSYICCMARLAERNDSEDITLNAEYFDMIMTDIANRIVGIEHQLLAIK